MMIFFQDSEMKKFVAVWENQFFGQVTLCSERIPGKSKFLYLTPSVGY